MLEQIWLLGGKISGLVFGSIWLIGIVCQSAYNCYRFIADVGDKKPEVFIDEISKKQIFGDGGSRDEGNKRFWGFWGLGGLGITLLTILIWPIVYPILIVIGTLFAFRGFIRFKKKVNKALEKKE
ncbi:unnamed protein product [marine sediment metagenome]|uniref:Uncharacterized protein n=1 Tax=marine sediment metagenome TaxID=412755 RepID=X1D0M0_9ZZZZ